MPLPTTDTTVTYPGGATTSTGTVLHVKPLPDGRSAVLLDTTAFHPVDTAWPDQPADRGTITTSAGTQPIVDGVTGGIRDGELHLGADMPVWTGTEGWTFVVAHIIEGPRPAVGEPAQIDVDQDYRAALSAAHTACHLAAHRSTDTYRIGKSLRRKGFTPTSLDDLSAVAERVNAQLAQWIEAGGAVRIDRDDSALSARRTWVCGLPDRRTNIPCGGTHIHNIASLSDITTSAGGVRFDEGILPGPLPQASFGVPVPWDWAIRGSKLPFPVAHFIGGTVTADLRAGEDYVEVRAGVGSFRQVGEFPLFDCRVIPGGHPGSGPAADRFLESPTTSSVRGTKPTGCA